MYSLPDKSKKAQNQGVSYSLDEETICCFVYCSVTAFDCCAMQLLFITLSCPCMHVTSNNVLVSQSVHLCTVVTVVCIYAKMYPLLVGQGNCALANWYFLSPCLFSNTQSYIIHVLMCMSVVPTHDFQMGCDNGELLKQKRVHCQECLPH